jgi:formamidopyrimidine-DNA glycosylase
VPELPEVETVRRTLAPAIGARITAIRSSGKPLRLNRPMPIAALKKALVGRTISGLRRHGKYLLVDTDGGHALLVHLGMSGRFRMVSGREAAPPHTHLVIALDDGRQLRFIDPRRFGQIDLVRLGEEKSHPSLAVLGRDPIVEKVGGAWLFEQARGRAVSLKSFLLDQSVLAGVGNIYASEALWRANLRPSRRTGRLDAAAAKVLARAVRHVLEHALDKGGTSLRDFVDADGQEGDNYDYLKVYGRDGQPCPRCRTLIQRSVIQGRATFFCPTCQVP